MKASPAVSCSTGRAREIRVSYIDGPFRHLENVWSFRPAGDAACDVGFRISYEFRSRLLQTLMGAVFDTRFPQIRRRFRGARRSDLRAERTAAGEAGAGQGAARQRFPVCLSNFKVVATDSSRISARPISPKFST